MEYTEGLKRAFGQALIDFRQRAGISQENLAYKVGINRTYVSMIERGVRNPSLEAIFKLADGVNAHPEELVHATRIRLGELNNQN